MRAGALGLTTVAAVALLATAPAQAQPQVQPRLYLLSGSGKTLVSVRLSRRDATPSEALRLLVASPRASINGRRSAFPQGSAPSAVAISGGTATVELHGRSLAALRTIPRLRVIASVTWTLTSFPTIKRTRFELDNRLWGVYNHRGQIIRDYTRGAWLPACAPGDGCFQP